MNNEEKEQHERERLEALAQLENWMEMPMVALGFVWLALLVFELTRGLHPVLVILSLVIWGGVFIVDFALKFILAPHKPRYLAHNWLTAIALFVPALRVFRIFGHCAPHARRAMRCAASASCASSPRSIAVWARWAAPCAGAASATQWRSRSS